MQINETLAFLQQQEVYAVNNNRQAKDDEEQSSSGLPFTWGEDKVSFSAEALAQAEKSQSGTNGDDSGEQTKEAFQAFMDKAQGRTPSESSDEARLKTLEKELANLQSQLSQILSDDSMDDSARESKINAINAKITAIMEEISKLDPKSAGGEPTKAEPAQEAGQAA